MASTSYGYRAHEVKKGRWRAFWLCDSTCPASLSYGHCKSAFHSKSSFPTKSEALAYGKAQHEDALKHGYVAKNVEAPTVTEAAEHWLKGRLGVRPSTRKQNESYVKSLIVPYLGTRPIDKLTTPIIKHWVADLAEADKSPSTVEKAHRFLFMILDTAADDGLVRRDRLPQRLKSTHLPKREDRKPNPMTYDQLMTLAEVVDPRYRITILLGGLAGLRFGEVAGLTPASYAIKDDGPYLLVSHQLNRDGVLAPCKTDASERSIAIGLVLNNALTGYRQSHKLSPIGTIITAPRGGAVSPYNYRRDVWLPAMERMRELDPTWEHRTFHDLRHTYASLLIAAGEHPKVIQEAMGHSSIRVTMDIYGHLMDGMTASARSAIDSFGPSLTAVAEAV